MGMERCTTIILVSTDSALIRQYKFTSLKKCKLNFTYKGKFPWEKGCKYTTNLWLGSGSLSSPMREHRNFAQFYCISVTNFSTVSECILLEIIWIKGTFAFLWLFLCLHAMYLEKSPVDFLREVFAVCLVPIPRSETWTKTVDVFIRLVTKRYAFYTAICGITGSEIECRFQWCKCHGRLQTSLVARTHFSRKLAKKNQF